MTDFKRAYQRSELHTAPRRRCPACGTTVAAKKGERTVDLEAEIEPEYLVHWRCGTSKCEGEQGF
ncbi:hypothetical protein [Streptomyces sp. SYSU K217416]